MPPGLLEDLDLLGRGRRDLFGAVRLVAHGNVGYHAQVHILVPFQMQTRTEGVFPEPRHFKFFRQTQDQGFRGQGHLLPVDGHGVGQRRRGRLPEGRHLGSDRGMRAGELPAFQVGQVRKDVIGSTCWSRRW